MKQEKTNVMRILDSHKVEYKSYSYVGTDAVSGVEVAKVNTMNCKGRYVRHGATGGYRPDWKKAIVTLSDNSNTLLEGSA